MPQAQNIIIPPVGIGVHQGQVMTAGVSTSDATTGTSSGCVWHGLVPGAQYSMWGAGAYTAGATTTAIQFSLLRSNGLTLTAEELNVAYGTTGGASEWIGTNSTTDGFTAGANSGGATPRPFSIEATFVVSAGGSLTLQIRSEVGASAVTVSRGFAILQRLT